MGMPNSTFDASDGGGGGGGDDDNIDSVIDQILETVNLFGDDSSAPSNKKRQKVTVDQCLFQNNQGISASSTTTTPHDDGLIIGAIISLDTASNDLVITRSRFEGNDFDVSILRQM